MRAITLTLAALAALAAGCAHQDLKAPCTAAADTGAALAAAGDCGERRPLNVASRGKP